MFRLTAAAACTHNSGDRSRQARPSADAHRRRQNRSGTGLRICEDNLPKADREVARETFTFSLDKARLKEGELRDGHYPRTNLVVEDPAVLCDRYIQPARIEATFNCLTSELGIRSIYHLEHLMPHTFPTTEQNRWGGSLTRAGRPRQLVEVSTKSEWPARGPAADAGADAGVRPTKVSPNLWRCPLRIEKIVVQDLRSIFIEKKAYIVQVPEARKLSRQFTG